MGFGLAVGARQYKGWGTGPRSALRIVKPNDDVNHPKHLTRRIPAGVERPAPLRVPTPAAGRPHFLFPRLMTRRKFWLLGGGVVLAAGAATEWLMERRIGGPRSGPGRYGAPSAVLLLPEEQAILHLASLVPSAPATGGMSMSKNRHSLDDGHGLAGPTAAILQ